LAIRLWLLGLGILLFLGLVLWSDDAITLQGERTVYTVDCRQGAWVGRRCSGELVASDRYRFRALKARREVLFWRAGIDEPSGRFTNCEIKDGRNWKCPAAADAARTVTREMLRGRPVAVADGAGRALHAVAKWRWWLLHWGFPSGGGSDDSAS
jgi:hypothetical protein